MMSFSRLENLKKRVDKFERKLIARKLEISYEAFTKRLGGFRAFRGTELVRLDAILDAAEKSEALNRR